MYYGSETVAHTASRCITRTRRASGRPADAAAYVDSDIYIPPLTGKPEQQRFTVRSGVLTSTSSRRRGAISGHPFPERTDFGPTCVYAPASRTMAFTPVPQCSPATTYYPAKFHLAVNKKFTPTQPNGAKITTESTRTFFITNSMCSINCCRIERNQPTTFVQENMTVH